MSLPCGKGGIRTLEELSPLPLFESGAFDHSATFPFCVDSTLPFFAIFTKNDIVMHADTP